MTSVDRIQGLSGSLAVKTPCRVATTANITLSGEQTIDAVAVVDGDRVLVKNQTSSVDNGIYNVSTGHWSRALDFDGANDFVQGTAIVVQQGTTYANTMWKVTTATPVIGSALAFDQLVPGDASAVEFVQAGTGATPRTVQTKLQESVSVKDFGAVGDGVTDDAAAISQAIASGRLVYFPAGTYLIGSPVIKSSLTGFSLVGDGVGLSTIKCHASATFTNSAVGFVSCDYFSVEGITFDQNNNSSFGLTYPLFICISCNDLAVRKCEFKKFTYIGVAMNSVRQFEISSNLIEKDATAATENYAINVSSTVFASKNGFIQNNYCKRSGSFYKGVRLVISGNVFDENGFGTAINTSGAGEAEYGSLVISGNICYGGTGLDVNGVAVAGMEIVSDNTIVNDNICLLNAGDGIALAGQACKISDNVCIGNGTYGLAGHRNGIQVSYISASVNANYAHISGNYCYDLGTGDQLYGYYESDANGVGISLLGNKLDRNATAAALIQGTAGWYETDWISYTPTMVSQTGTITTLGTLSGRYKRAGKLVHFNVSCTITTNGTGATGVDISLPFSVANGPYVAHGRENGVSGHSLVGQLLNGQPTVRVTKYDATYPGVNGAVILVSGFYEIA